MSAELAPRAPPAAAPGAGGGRRRAAFRWCADGAARPSRSSISPRRVGADDLAAALTVVVADAAQAPAAGRLCSMPRRLVDLAQRLAGAAARAQAGARPARGRHPLGRRDAALVHGRRPMLTTVLQPGQAEWAGLATRRETLDAVRAALRGGVRAVNLCSLDGLARELYTYEGSGTLFTLRGLLPHRAARHRRLRRGRAPHRARPARGLSQAAHADRGRAHPPQRLRRRDRLAPLRRRLRPRDRRRIAPDRVGEIVGLYTITRFKGEGVGGRLLARVVDEARGDRSALRVRLHGRRARRGVLRAPGLPSAFRPTTCRPQVGRLRPPTARPHPACCAAIWSSRMLPDARARSESSSPRIGVAVLIGVRCGQFARPTDSGDFRKAQMLRERNPGNAMYDLQFFVAASRIGVPHRRRGRRRPAGAERRDPDAGSDRQSERQSGRRDGEGRVITASTMSASWSPTSMPRCASTPRRSGSPPGPIETPRAAADPPLLCPRRRRRAGADRGARSRADDDAPAAAPGARPLPRRPARRGRRRRRRRSRAPRRPARRRASAKAATCGSSICTPTPRRAR